jgi:hypothetical protein
MAMAAVPSVSVLVDGTVAETAAGSVTWYSRGSLPSTWRHRINGRSEQNGVLRQYGVPRQVGYPRSPQHVCQTHVRRSTAAARQPRLCCHRSARGSGLHQQQPASQQGALPMPAGLQHRVRHKEVEGLQGASPGNWGWRR